MSLMSLMPFARALRAHRIRRAHDGAHHARVRAAAAQVARHALADLRLVGAGVALQQRHRRDHHARRAIAALRRLLGHEGALHRVRRGARAQAFGGLHALAGERPHRRVAAGHRAAVHQHHAGAALARAAAEVARAQAQVVAQHVEQRALGVDRQLARGAVDE
jgi:hypothetical protein